MRPVLVLARKPTLGPSSPAGQGFSLRTTLTAAPRLSCWGPQGVRSHLRRGSAQRAFLAKCGRVLVCQTRAYGRLSLSDRAPRIQRHLPDDFCRSHRTAGTGRAGLGGRRSGRGLRKPARAGDFVSRHQRDAHWRFLALRPWQPDGMGPIGFPVQGFRPRRKRCILRSAESFYKRGRSTLLIAKFIPGVNSMAPPLAGSMKMPFAQFLGLDLAGAAAFYALAYGSVGFLFGNFSRGHHAAAFEPPDGTSPSSQSSPRSRHSSAIVCGSTASIASTALCRAFRSWS